MKGKEVEGKKYPRKIGRRRLRYIKDEFDSFLSGLFKEGEMVEVVIKPVGRMLEVTFEDVSESKEGEEDENTIGKESEGQIMFNEDVKRKLVERKYWMDKGKFEERNKRMPTEEESNELRETAIRTVEEAIPALNQEFEKNGN